MLVTNIYDVILIHDVAAQLQIQHNALFYDDNSGSHRDRQQSFTSNNNRFRNSLTVSTDEYEDESSIHDIHLKGSE
jgi:hypothetical protein